MLDNGGVEVVTDNIRTADTDNPKGYYEFEKVKKIKQDSSWLPGTRGKVFKMVSQLLYDLPKSEEYRVIFMERDLDEVLASQEKMLQRLGQRAAPRDQMKRSYGLHLDKLHRWLGEQSHLEILRVRYNELIQKPDAEAQRVNEFLGGRANTMQMAKTVDPALYRNRKSVSELCGNPFSETYNLAGGQLILWWDI
jgi:sulfotransferase family protein